MPLPNWFVGGIFCKLGISIWLRVVYLWFSRLLPLKCDLKLNKFYNHVRKQMKRLFSELKPYSSGPSIFLRLWSLHRLVTKSTHLDGVGLFSPSLIELKRFEITVYCVKLSTFLEYLSLIFDSTILIRKPTIPKSIPITLRETAFHLKHEKLPGAMDQTKE